MSEPSKKLELQFQNCNLGISARRLWEHTELGQANVFGKAINGRSDLNDATDFIDVVRFDTFTVSLAGFTVAQLRDGQIPAHRIPKDVPVLLAGLATRKAVAFVAEVAAHIEQCSLRQATRNKEILATAKAGFDFQSKVSKANEGLWQDTWNAAKNPFEAWWQYKKDARKRKPIVSAWIAARDYYDSLPKPKKAD